MGNSQKKLLLLQKNGLKFDKKLKKKIVKMFIRFSMTNENKQWKNVNGLTEFKDFDYNVSEYGEVVSNRTKRALKPTLSNGYYNICFNCAGKSKQVTLGRLVAKLFVEDKKGDFVVNHIDGDKTNNYYQNLEWTTQQENVKHANDNNLVGYHPKAVIKLDKNSGEELKTFESVIEASKDINLTTHSIFKVLRGQNQTAGGFKWKYVNDEDNMLKLEDDILTEGKSINGLEQYLVFPDGRIYSKRQKKFLKPVINASGYSYVTLKKPNEKKKNHYIQTIVAEHFLEVNEIKKYVTHINGDRSDNHVENLKWTNKIRK